MGKTLREQPSASEFVFCEEYMREQLGILYEALREAELAYHELLMRGLELRGAFNRALLISSKEFSSHHRQVIEGRSNPKAAGLWAEYNVKAKTGDMVRFLGMCFSDTCGPLLQQSIMFDMLANGEIKTAKIDDAIKLGAVVAKGLSTVGENYDLLLKPASEKFPEMTQLADVFSQTMGIMHESVDNLIAGCGSRQESVEKLAQTEIRQQLTASESMAYLRLISPPVWAEQAKLVA